MMGHRFREENEVVRHLCCLHGRKRWEKLLDLAAPSLPRTHHLYRSGALSYEVGQVPIRGLFTCVEGLERKGEWQQGDVMTESTLEKNQACQSHPGVTSVNCGDEIYF